MKILYIAREFGLKKTGANQVMKRNRDVLRKIVGKGLYEFYVPSTNRANVLESLVRLSGYGIDYSTEKKIIEVVDMIKPDWVFIDSSSFGSIVKKIKVKGFKIICFAHNVDTELCRQEIKSRLPFIAIPKFLSMYWNERRTMKYANCIIALNQRDSDGFDKLFGREADLILPITFDVRRNVNHNRVEVPYFLFVGSDFFPNIEGLKWFLEKVAPYVNGKIRVVGSCCENQIIKSGKWTSNVELIGYTEDIEKEYDRAFGIIAPIFKGSGMKTKTIEALRFGKYIYGTTEAFEGIECNVDLIGGLCNTANEFIEKLNSCSHGTYNQYAERLFESRFSNSYFENELKNFLDNEYTH